MKPVALVLSLAVLAAPAGAAADDSDGIWHADGFFGAVVPLGLSGFTDATGFGGRLGTRGYRGPFEASVDLTFFAEDRGGELAEAMPYRLRALAGYRYQRDLTDARSIVLRALAGPELGAFDDISSGDWAAEEHRFGAAIELGAESRSALDWGGIVSLSIGLGLSVQPFGDDDAGEARYLGIELLAGASIGI